MCTQAAAVKFTQPILPPQCGMSNPWAQEEEVEVTALRPLPSMNLMYCQARKRGTLVGGNWFLQYLAGFWSSLCWTSSSVAEKVQVPVHVLATCKVLDNVKLVWVRQVGPLAAHYNTTVPLWVGIKLVERGFAEIKVPEWMHKERLSLAHKHEQDNEDFSPDVPFYYYEVFQELSSISGTLKEEGEIRELVDAVHNSRMRKIWEQLKKPEQACFQHIGSIELRRIRDVWREVVWLKWNRAEMKRETRKKFASQRDSGLGLEGLVLDEDEAVRRIRRR